MVDQWIHLGGGPSIGKITIDEANVRGEGGPTLPQLVVPMTIALDPQPDGKTIAVLALRASLYSAQQTSASALACRPIEIGLTSGFIAWSMTNGRPGSNNVELRFFPTPGEITALERKRHEAASDRFSLYLDLRPSVGGLYNFNQSQQTSSDARAGPFDDMGLGMYAQVFNFWTATVQPLFMSIERSTWIERVLPGLGYDSVRLVEVNLPPHLPLHGSAGTEFDKAKRALDERRYTDCVAACRGLTGIWETTLGATRHQRVAQVVASRLGWKETDARKTFIDDLWKAANDISNVPHHPESQTVAPQDVEPRDARLLFLLVSGLSEYLGTLP